MSTYSKAQEAGVPGVADWSGASGYSKAREAGFPDGTNGVLYDNRGMFTAIQRCTERI